MLFEDSCNSGENKNAYKLLVGKPEGKRLLGRQDVGGWIIFRWILEIWTGLVWLRIGTNGGLK
jgi:hypothetical protein